MHLLRVSLSRTLAASRPGTASLPQLAALLSCLARTVRNLSSLTHAGLEAGQGCPDAFWQIMTVIAEVNRREGMKR